MKKAAEKPTSAVKPAGAKGETEQPETKASVAGQAGQSPSINKMVRK